MPSNARLDLIDSHAHLDPAFFGKKLPQIIAESVSQLSAVVAIGSGGSPASAREAIQLAEREPTIAATVGVHPHDAGDLTAERLLELGELAATETAVAVGETGLDYYYDRSPRAAQRASFRAQIELARRVDKPLVLHIRDAWDDALTILDDEGGAAVGGVVHCFTGSDEAAAAMLERGFYLGVTGIVTYRDADTLRDTLRAAPLDRLLLETDSPYLTPRAARGERPNRPVLVRHVAAAIAELKGLRIEEVARRTSENVRRLLGLPGTTGEP